MNTTKTIIKSTLIGALVLWTCSGRGGSAVPSETNEFKSFVKQRQSELREIVRISKDPLKAEASNALERLDQSQDPLQLLVALGHAAQSGPDTIGFLRQDAIVACLVQGLLHPQGEVRRYSLNELDDYVLPSEYCPYVHALIAAYPKNQSRALMRMIGACRSPEGDAFLRDLRGRLQAQQDDLPEEVQAKLGYPGVEASLIARFHAETNCVEKGKLALKLGYVGTTNTLRALAEEMRCPLTVDPGASVRAMIVRAFGRAMPQSRLFNEEYNTAARSGSLDEEDKYIARVEKWCGQTFGVQWQRERPKIRLVMPFAAE